jgi:hypothetical protein
MISQLRTRIIKIVPFSDECLSPSPSPRLLAGMVKKKETNTPYFCKLKIAAQLARAGQNELELSSKAENTSSHLTAVNYYVVPLFITSVLLKIDQIEYTVYNIIINITLRSIY